MIVYDRTALPRLSGTESAAAAALEDVWKVRAEVDATGRSRLLDEVRRDAHRQLHKDPAILSG